MAGYEYYTVQNIIKQDNKKEARVEREWKNKLYSEKDCIEKALKVVKKRKLLALRTEEKK